jgi:hypothetical protein
VAFLAVGQDEDGWKVRTEHEVLVGVITDCRTDDGGKPIMIRVDDIWVPWRQVLSLRNITEENRKKKGTT